MNDQAEIWYQWHAQAAQNDPAWQAYLSVAQAQASDEQLRQLALAAANAQSYDWRYPFTAQDKSIQVASISPVPQTRSWAVLGSPRGILMKLLQLGLLFGVAAVCICAVARLSTGLDWFWDPIGTVLAILLSVNVFVIQLAFERESLFESLFYSVKRYLTPGHRKVE